MISRVRGEAAEVDSTYEPASADDIAAAQSAKADQAALTNAGVTDQSGFSNASAPLVASAQLDAPATDTSTPTVRASQLANGTATLDAAAASTTAAEDVSGWSTPADPSNLAAITTSGADGLTH